MKEDYIIEVGAGLSSSASKTLRSDLKKLEQELAKQNIKINIKPSIDGKNKSLVKEINDLYKSGALSSKELLQYSSEFLNQRDKENATWKETQSLLSNLKKARQELGIEEVKSVNVAKEQADITKTLYSADGKALTIKQEFNDELKNTEKITRDATTGQVLYSETIDRTGKTQKDAIKAQQTEQVRLVKSLQSLKEKSEESSKSMKNLLERTKDFGTHEDREKVKKYVAELEKFGARADELSKSTNISGDEVKELNHQFRLAKIDAGDAGKQLKALSNNSMHLSTMMSVAVKKFIAWQGVTTLFLQSIRTIRKMIEEVKELDDAMLELSKVTEMTEAQQRSFANAVDPIGEKLNATTASVVRATAEFKRMGFSISESLQLAESAIVLTKIADGINDVTEASTAMISILKGFNMTASDSTHVIDAINEVSNNFAINTDDLADGLRRTAGVLAQTGTTFEESIGILTGGQEQLQQIEKVSSGLITISTRLRAVTEDGEEIEGLMPKLQEAFDKYANSVKIQEVDGELRSTYDILKDLAGVWGSLNDEAKSEIGFLVSGTRQAPVLNSILGNLNHTMDATKMALNSNGSAAEEFEKYSKSLQGRLDALKQSWADLSNDIISSKLVSWVLGATNSFIEFMDSGIGLVAIISTIVLITQILAKKSLITLIASLIDSIVQLKILTAEFWAATASAEAFKAAISLGLSTIVAGLVALVIEIRNARKEFEELKEMSKDTKTLALETKNAISNMADSKTEEDINKAKDALDAFGESLSFIESSEPFSNARKRIAEYEKDIIRLKKEIAENPEDYDAKATLETNQVIIEQIKEKYKTEFDLIDEYALYTRDYNSLLISQKFIQS
ncbi:MAG: phage tail tape measure protein, partial [Spirochaetales bacterium]|nr:phage tail tape measure protein [Spirochaetales bacterium]